MVKLAGTSSRPSRSCQQGTNASCFDTAQAIAIFTPQWDDRNISHAKWSDGTQSDSNCSVLRHISPSHNHSIIPYCNTFDASEGIISCLKAASDSTRTHIPKHEGRQCHASELKQNKSKRRISYSLSLRISYSLILSYRSHVKDGILIVAQLSCDKFPGNQMATNAFRWHYWLIFEKVRRKEQFLDKSFRVTSFHPLALLLFP